LNKWMLLVYKVPSEPSARRVYVWRKLKRLGAILLHDAVWILPATDHTREQFQWLAAEIMEMGGEAHVWEAQHLFADPEATLIRQFEEQIDTAYQEILEAIDQEDADLTALARRYQQIKSQDYFQSPVGEQVREALLQKQGGDRS